MKIYFDTSYLVALYVPNDHTAAALRFHVGENEQPMLFSPLHRLELRTTVRQCVFAGLLKESEGRRILRHIEEDLDDGTLLHEPLDWIESLPPGRGRGASARMEDGLPFARPLARGRCGGNRSGDLRQL